MARSRRTLESRQNMDDDKITMLEEELRKAKSVAIEAERNYEEVCCSCSCIVCGYFSLMSAFLISFSLLLLLLLKLKGPNIYISPLTRMAAFYDNLKWCTDQH